MKILSVEQLYEADRITIENQNISSTDLMERASYKVFQWIHERLQDSQINIHIFCGVGNNGGDGLVVGRLLIEHGYNVNMYVINFSNNRSKDFLINYDRIKSITKKWPVLMKGKSDYPTIDKEDIVIDAIFGIGLNRSPGGWVKNLIQFLNKREAFKLSIDIPSGLFANKPITDAEAVLLADHTLTFQVPKLSFFLPETARFVLSFEILDIELDIDFIDKSAPLAQLISKYEAQTYYIHRDRFGHKGTYGHTVIIGGSYGKIGAVTLATSTAFRIGAGMVTAVVPKCGYSILQTSVPEAMVLTDDEDNFLTDIQLNFEPSAIAIGMGLGKNQATVKGLKVFLKSVKAPLVIDADALNIISENKELLELIPKNSILTPHPGELKRLIGDWKNDYDKIEKAKSLSKEREVILIIKGAYTITVFGDSLYINTSGNPGMATAGSGDALSGVIAGLLSQSYKPLEATVFGVYMHGSAGDIASGQMGYESIMASDIINNISEAYMDLFTHPEYDNNEEPGANEAEDI
ncbi:MAG TPA: NAD(P)H-hydrate dehydratase [Aequorivita sp.]|nr:NAD(P)H-hydrate dehydratase [Aequorivita sp.]